MVPHKPSIQKSMLMKLFDAAFIQRWNDKVRPVDLTELDKQAHKMVIAYCLGKSEETTPGFNWIEIIEGGIFELLQRIVLTDLKPPVFHKIRSDADKYRRLNNWVYEEHLKDILAPLGKDFCERFQNYFTQTDENINRQILSAAHFYATKWEFDIIEKANPNSYDIEEIKADIQSKQAKYSNLPGFQRLVKDKNITRFINLCGELRFQIRWSNIYRIPKTSVMGHMLFVAIVSYLFSLEINACPQRAINNFFTGLFHDLPEVLTRDIISPVKRAVEGLDDLIKDYEVEMMQKEVYSILPSAWHTDIKMFTEHEFSNTVVINNKINDKVDNDTINQKYNHDRFNPRDGKLIKAADMLAAFIEAHVATLNGSASQDLHDAKKNIKYIYQSEHKHIAGIDFGRLYHNLD
ncbi:HD domain-containing protein [bacterium]|nr:HD domain-containing protein [bacterium]